MAGLPPSQGWSHCPSDKAAAPLRPPICTPTPPRRLSWALQKANFPNWNRLGQW